MPQHSKKREEQELASAGSRMGKEGAWWETKLLIPVPFLMGTVFAGLLRDTMSLAGCV